LGISADTEIFCFARPAVFWRVKNSGASTLSGNSTSTPSLAETGAGLGSIIARRFFHMIVTRPRLSPGSISSAGRVAFAPIMFVWPNSFLMESGHFSASADNGTRMESSTETRGAALTPPAADAADADATGAGNGIGAVAAGCGTGETDLTGAGLGVVAMGFRTNVGGSSAAADENGIGADGTTAAGAAGVGAPGAGLGGAAMVFGAAAAGGATGVGTAGLAAGAGALGGGVGAALTGA
jgi:hypothetical protein